jgi:hypothetical protein
MKEFIKDFDFSRKSYQDYLRFACTQGNKEDFFSFMLARDLDIYLSQKYPNFYVETQFQQDKSKVTSGVLLSEDTKTWKYATGGNGRRQTDIAILGSDDEVTDLMEFKTDRHGAYTDNLENGVRSKRHWDEKSLNDISILIDKKIEFPDIRCWVGTLLYSFQPTGLDFPSDYPKYVSYEKRSRVLGESPVNQKVLDKWCDQRSDQFISYLMKIRGKIPHHDRDKKELMRQIRIEREDFVCKTVARGEHRGVLVRSDLIFFEVQLP